MTGKDLSGLSAGFRDASVAASALLFLHELLAAETAGQPPRNARWQRILERPEHEWGRVLDRACQACLRCWPEQLDGFFADVRFEDEPAHALRRGIEGAQRLAAQAEHHGGPVDRRTLLADVNQHLRSLATKQWQGAFFTPWNVAYATALPMFDTAAPCEEWILEPCVGGGVMLIAALDAYRHLHGPDAARAITLIGVDIDRRSCQIARASLLLAGANPDQFWIFAGNSLAQPIVGRDRRDGALREITFSAILTNRPFGTKTSAAELGAHAARGPLVIPDHVLYRRLPAIGDRQRPHEPAPVVPERVGAPFEQLRLEWVA